MRDECMITRFKIPFLSSLIPPPSSLLFRLQGKRISEETRVRFWDEAFRYFLYVPFILIFFVGGFRPAASYKDLRRSI